MTAFSFVLAGSLGAYLLFALFLLTGLYRLRRAGKHTIQAPVDLPTVTVIVAARNEERHLPGLLEDLLRQNYPPDKLELVIADDRSSDRTGVILAEFANRNPRLRIVTISERSSAMAPKKFALSQAIDNSTGAIIIATDADCRVPATWVSATVRCFDDATGIVVGFSSVITDPDNFTTRYQQLDFLALLAANAGSLGWGKAWSGSGQNIAYRRSCFQAIDGFQPVAHLLSGDDMYLVQTIARVAGIRFNTDPRGAVTTQPVVSLPKFFRQRIRWASNSRRSARTDRWFFLFLLSAFLVNTVILIGLFTRSLLPVLAALLTKGLFDYLVIIGGARPFAVRFRFGLFLIWLFLQPVYIPTVGLLGLAGKFRWKQ